MGNSKILLQTHNLKKHFISGDGFWGLDKTTQKAVDGVSVSIIKGEVFGLVGESGCGKTTLGRALLRLCDITEGKVIFDDHDITKLNHKQMLPLRRRMQIIFQDPYASLNPRMTVNEILSEPLVIHNLSEHSRHKAVGELLDKVGLHPRVACRYPHEFSGGQRQRIGIARALAVQPDFIVCDEPISALDVSIQAQVINLLKELQSELGLTYLFIAHDLTMVRYISDRIGVMYLGKLVELADSNELYQTPAHPYTRALISAVPTPYTAGLGDERRISLEGEVPVRLDTAVGCRFRPRCRLAHEVCGRAEPQLAEVECGHFVACHLVK